MKILMRKKVIIGTLVLMAVLVAPMQAFAGFVERDGAGPERNYILSIQGQVPGTNSVLHIDLTVDGSASGLPTGTIELLAIRHPSGSDARFGTTSQGISAHSMELLSATYRQFPQGAPPSTSLTMVFSAKGSAHTVNSSSQRHTTGDFLLFVQVRIRDSNGQAASNSSLVLIADDTPIAGSVARMSFPTSAGLVIESTEL